MTAGLPESVQREIFTMTRAIERHRREVLRLYAEYVDKSKAALAADQPAEAAIWDGVAVDILARLTL